MAGRVELVLIRHTRTCVPAGTCYGHLDVALADTCSADIDAALSTIPRVDGIFSSPSQRCTRLAAVLAQRDGCPLHSAEALRELDFGAWEGRTWHDIPRAQSDPWADDPWLCAPPGGETEAQLWQRVDDWRARHLTGHGGRIAIVAHGGSLRALRCQLLRLAPRERWSWQIAQGASVLVEYLPHAS